MKKSLYLLVTIVIIMSIGAFCFVGCKKPNIDTTGMFPEENLAYAATISATSGKNSSALIDGKNSTAWVVDEGVKDWSSTNGMAYAELDFGADINFNTIVLKEKGDNLDMFRLHAFKNGAWEMIYQQDRIMAIRTCYVEEQFDVSKLRLEVVENRGKTSITDIQIYNQAKRDKNFKITDYCTFDYDKETNTNKITTLENDPGFIGYFNVVTDLIIIGCVTLDSNGNIAFADGEENFAKSLDSLRKIIAKSSNPDVKIWSTILFRVGDITNTNHYNVTAKYFKNNMDIVSKNVKAFVEKYNLYGVDYDWEYPYNASQWNAYNLIVTETAKFTKVSVALPPWGIKFSKAAIAAIEHVNVMTYDLFDNRGDHSNMITAGISAANYVISAGFSREQVLLGIPTYARTTNGSGDAWPEFVKFPELGKWGNLIKDFPYNELQADKETYLPATCDAYFNGYAMTRDKTLTAIDMNLGGIMIFRAKCDAPYTYEFSLHKAMEEVIKNRIGN